MKNLTLTIALIIISLNVFAQSKTDPKKIILPSKIVSIEYGVTCGKTGKSAVYVYLKNKSAKGFNVKTDRKTIYTENLSQLRKKVEYQYYIKNL